MTGNALAKLRASVVAGLCLVMACTSVALADGDAKDAAATGAVAKPQADAAKKQADAAKEQADAAKEKAETPSVVEIGGLEWRTDYGAAYQAAKKGKRMLLINFVGAADSAQQQGAEKYMDQKNMRDRLVRVERLRVPVDAAIKVDEQSQRLLGFPVFAELNGGPGFVLLDLRHVGAPYYGSAVSVLPYASGKFYHWQDSHLHVMLDLPPGTLTQRSMIFAVRIHPEGPASTWGMHHPTLASGAAQHSSYQASIGVQGHQNFESRYGQLSGAAGGAVSEVVAESWPGQNMIDSCIDCVQSWRHSPGHWRGVAGRHRAFGYDIRRGRNGIWYGTGIFAN